MSDQTPSTPGQPEYLGGPRPFEDEPAPRGSGRRWGAIGAASAGVVLVAGVGGWGVAQLLSGGESPATAVPASAVGYVSVDLDPSAGQKIEAMRTLKKFPAIADHLDLGVKDDLRRWVFEQIQEQDACKDLDYGRDVEPWLGDRVALAAVPKGKDSVTPLVVVQVKDREAAAAGVEAIGACAQAATDGRGAASGQDGAKPAGVAFVGEYMLVTESAKDADALAAAAEKGSLQDNPAFTDWMRRVGDPGVVTGYVSAEAPALMEAVQKKQMKAFLGDDSAQFSFEEQAVPDDVPPAHTSDPFADDAFVKCLDKVPPGTDPFKRCKRFLPAGDPLTVAPGPGVDAGPFVADDESALMNDGMGMSMFPFPMFGMFGMFGGPGSGDVWKDFDGMAGVVRFGDGSIEAEVASSGLPAGVASTDDRTGPSLGDLPDTTAAAFTVSLPEHWLRGYLDALGETLSWGQSPDTFWKEAEAESGLNLPEDIETLLGDGLSVSVDSSADFKTLVDSPGVPQTPLALRISGDPDKINGVLDTLLRRLGPDRDSVVVKSGDGAVVVGLDPAYVDQLLGHGGLGDSDAFRDVVPDPDRAAGALYVNFDAGDGWLERLGDDQDFRDNVAPLAALGLSSWRDGDVQHGLLKLTTD